MVKLRADNGHGVTRQSLDYWKDVAPVVKEDSVRRIVVSNRDLGPEDGVTRPGYTMKIEANGYKVLLSGCNCGYGGEGPHGSLKVLEDIGVHVGQPLMALIATRDRLEFERYLGVWRVVPADQTWLAFVEARDTRNGDWGCKGCAFGNEVWVGQVRHVAPTNQDLPCRACYLAWRNENRVAA